VSACRSDDRNALHVFDRSDARLRDFDLRLISRAARRIAARMRRGESSSLIPIALPALVAQSASSFGLWPLFLFFLKVGSILFGSGYVLLAFLRADLVDRWRWLTEAQLLDAVTAGQVTPGSVFTTATFIGYILGGLPGAFLATVGIFLPAFFFVAVSGPLVWRIRRSATAGAVLDGINAASLSLMAVVTWRLGSAALVDWLTAAVFSMARAGRGIVRPDFSIGVISSLFNDQLI
jgi:chromate transporter